MSLDNVFGLVYVLLACFGAAALICYAFSAKMPGWFSTDRYDVTLQGFEAAEDGKSLMIQVARKWEKGVISDVFPEAEGSDLFVDFETENGNEMMPSLHKLELPPECDSIYFNRSEGKYLLVLKKDETGQWSDASKFYTFKERNNDNEDDESDEEEYDEGI